MTTISDHMLDANGWAHSAVSVEAKLKARDGGRAIKRGLQRFVGFTLCLAAFGIWIAPGATWDNELNLFKMLLSLVCAISGAAMWQVGKSAGAAPELEIDTIRQEVRLVRWEGTQRDLVARRHFKDIHAADINNQYVQLWEPSGALMAEMEIKDRGSLRALQAGLVRAGVDVKAAA